MKEMKEKQNSDLSLKEAVVEYLKIYGWVILIIGLALVVMYSLGVFNPKKVGPGFCFVFRPFGLLGWCNYLPRYVASFNEANEHPLSPLSDRYVEVPYLSIFNNHSFTVALWAYFNDELGNDKGLFADCPYDVICFGAFDKGLVADCSFHSEPSAIVRGRHENSPSVTDQCLHITRRNVKPYFSFYNDDLAGNTYLARNKWWFLVFTWDSSTKQRKIYVNGVLDASDTSTGSLTVPSYPLTIGPFTLPSSPGSIGGIPTLLCCWMNGSIANVQIYDTVLTADEIKYLYQKGLGGAPIRLEHLVAWWPLNGNAKDYSGNGLDGFAYGVDFIQNYPLP